MELPETEHELNALIERANRKKDELASGAVAEFNALVQKVKDAASDLGISHRALARKFKVVKYVHPEDESKTWSGVGKAPKWFDRAVLVE
jgi:DNA-binding protein H-NS